MHLMLRRTAPGHYWVVLDGTVGPYGVSVPGSSPIGIGEANKPIDTQGIEGLLPGTETITSKGNVTGTANLQRLLNGE